MVGPKPSLSRGINQLCQCVAPACETGMEEACKGTTVQITLMIALSESVPPASFQMPLVVGFIHS